MEAERDRARQAVYRPPPSPPPKEAPRPPSDRELQDIREEIEREKVLLQKRAIEFLEREETLRERETKAEDEGRLLHGAREEVDRLRGELDAMKAAPAGPVFDGDAARRDIEARATVLQQKTFELLAREEQLRKRAGEIQALLDSAT